jgi:hypothetical protein
MDLLSFQVTTISPLFLEPCDPLTPVWLAYSHVVHRRLLSELQCLVLLLRHDPIISIVIYHPTQPEKFTETH